MTCIFFSLSFSVCFVFKSRICNIHLLSAFILFHSPRWRFVLQTEISGKYNSPLYFCFLYLFFYHSSCRKDQFNVLNSRFYWSRSTKNPANPHWFVVVVLPSQVFPFWCCAKQYNIYWTNGVNNHTRSYVPREGGCFWREKTAPVVHWKLFNNFD